MHEREISASRRSISYSASPDRPVDVRVFDVRGRLVTELAHQSRTGGVLDWDGRSATGTFVPAGVYFVRVEREGDSQALRLVRVR